MIPPHIEDIYPLLSMQQGLLFHSLQPLIHLGEARHGLLCCLDTGLYVGNHKNYLRALGNLNMEGLWHKPSESDLLDWAINASSVEQKNSTDKEDKL